MNSKILFTLLISLFVVHTSLPILDASPWCIISNATKFPFSCQLDAIHYFDQDANFNVSMINHENLIIQYQQEVDEHGKLYTKFILFFDLPEGATITFNPIFYCEDVPFNPTITAVFFIQHDLQIMTFSDQLYAHDRYFDVSFDEEQGIVASSQSIPLYIKIANNAKQTLHNLLVSIMKLTKLLPY